MKAVELFGQSYTLVSRDTFDKPTLTYCRTSQASSMAKIVPDVLTDYVLPFNWQVERVWQLSAPVVEVDIAEFAAMFELPFWSSEPDAGMLFDLSPNQALAQLSVYPHQRRRVQAADTRYPVDLIADGGHRYILDGLHRMAKQKLQQRTRIEVRMHSMDVRRLIEVETER